MMVMIKRYKEFINEGLLDKLQGPNKEEIVENLKDNPFRLYQYAYDVNDDELKKYTETLITNEIKLEKVQDLSCFIVDIAGDETGLSDFGIPAEYWFEFKSNLEKEKNKHLHNNTAYNIIYKQVTDFLMGESLDDICDIVDELEINI